jgi:deoxyribonuclease-4
MAGQGTNVGYDFAQLGRIIEGINNKKRIGVCFDTCHAFAAGSDMRTSVTYHEVWKQFSRDIGLKYLHVIHLNDSKKELGSRVDRHEDIGKGKIGLEGFSLLMNDERFFDIPKILETPQGTLESYAKNMAVLRGLLTSHNKKLLGL